MRGRCCGLAGLVAGQVQPDRKRSRPLGGPGRLAVAVWKLGPDWGALIPQAATSTEPSRRPSRICTTPWQVFDGGSAHDSVGGFFFSRRRRGRLDDERPRDFMRSQLFIGSRSAACCPWPSRVRHHRLPRPRDHVDSLGQWALPHRRWPSGKIGLSSPCLGSLVSDLGAALLDGLSVRVQHRSVLLFGWQWGKFVKAGSGPPRSSTHLALSTCSRSPCSSRRWISIRVTEYSVVSARLPCVDLLPILVVAR